MPQFTVNPQRVDPYKNFKFRIKWDGRYVAGVSRISGPGRTEFEAITLERGVTHDQEFEKWASQVWNRGGGAGTEVALANFRKDIALELYNEAGQLLLAYKIYRCWVSEYRILP